MLNQKLPPFPVISGDSWLEEVFNEDDVNDSALDLDNNRIILGNGAYLRGAAHCDDFEQTYDGDYALS
jgi:hypothetical protein